MRLMDSHAHLDALPDGELAAQLARAAAAGVERIVAIGGHAAANARVAGLVAAHPDRLWGAIGYDRDQAGRPDAPAPGWEAALDAPGIVAVGECGLDYHYRPDSAPAQRALFETMAAAAARRGLPLVVHTREADDDTLAMLSAARAVHPDPDRLGVLHCFTRDEAMARRALDLGLYISLSGIVTFRSAAALRAVARMIPDDRLLIETDAPYLSPEPVRGRPNEPAHLPHTLAALAVLRGMSEDYLARICFENGERLFAAGRKSFRRFGLNEPPPPSIVSETTGCKPVEGT